MKALLFITIILDLIAIYRITNDEVVLFDNEKPKYIILVVLIPIIGAVIAIVKTSNTIKLRNKDLQDTPKLTQKSMHYDNNIDKLDFFNDLLD